MTRRWSLIAVIVGLAVALTFVIVDMRSGTGAARETPEAAGPAGHGGTPGLKGVGWWPAHATSGRVAKDLVGDHHATLRGGASWTTGPKGGALLLDGSSGFADTGAAVLDTADGDYSVSRLGPVERPRGLQNRCLPGRRDGQRLLSAVFRQRQAVLLQLRQCPCRRHHSGRTRTGPLVPPRRERAASTSANRIFCIRAS